MTNGAVAVRDRAIRLLAEALLAAGSPAAVSAETLLAALRANSASLSADDVAATSWSSREAAVASAMSFDEAAPTGTSETGEAPPDQDRPVASGTETPVSTGRDWRRPDHTQVADGEADPAACSSPEPDALARRAGGSSHAAPRFEGGGGGDLAGDDAMAPAGTLTVPATTPAPVEAPARPVTPTPADAPASAETRAPERLASVASTAADPPPASETSTGGSGVSAPRPAPSAGRDEPPTGPVDELPRTSAEIAQIRDAENALNDLVSAADGPPELAFEIGQAVLEVRDLAAEDPDFEKILRSMTEDELRQAIEQLEATG